jgi:hypothetical protein
MIAAEHGNLPVLHKLREKEEEIEEGLRKQKEEVGLKGIDP